MKKTIYTTLLICFTTLPNLQAKIYYAKATPTGTNSGNSWANAGSLLSMLDSAASGDSIWAAAGAYFPTSGSDRTATFRIKSGQRLFGGFAGTETTLSQRGSGNFFFLQSTILSGAIGTGANTDNSLHVVTLDSLNATTIIDGLFIGNGYNSSAVSSAYRGISSGNMYGGNIFIANSSNFLQVRKCYINNMRSSGATRGAVYIYRSSPTFTNCFWDENRQSFGAAVFHEGGGTSNYNQCYFKSNYATGNDGGVAYNGATMNFNNCVMFNNQADGQASILFNGSGSTANFTNCTMFDNFGNLGGVSGYAFLMRNNSASSTITMLNSIIWNGTAYSNDFVLGSGAQAIVATYSNIRTSTGTAYTGTGNVIANPLFINSSNFVGADLIWGSTDDGLNITACSPSKNTGTNSGAPLIDIMGTSRPQFTTFDMGAFETTLSPISRIYVKANATGANNGTSWTNAYNSLQSALSSCIGAGTEIWVANGTYFPSADANGNLSPSDNRDKTFFILNGVKLYGGFAGTETTLSQRILPTKGGSSTCILSGDIGTANDTTDNVYHIITATKQTTTNEITINGFTIKYGNANGSGNFLLSSGGGFQRDRASAIFVYDLPSVIQNNTFQRNFGESVAGSIYVYANNDANSAQPFSSRFVNNIIENNNASAPTVYYTYGKKYIANNLFLFNKSSSNTAGIYVFRGKDSCINNQFLYNTSSSRAGYEANSMDSVYAVHNIFANNTSSSTSITGVCMRIGSNFSSTNYTNISNNVFYNNVGGYNPGLEISVGTHSNIVRNNSFVKNRFTAGFGNMLGVMWLANGSFTVENNLFTGNDKNGFYDYVGVDYYGSSSTMPVFKNNILQRVENDFAYTANGNNALGTSATGNIFTQNAELVNAEDGDGEDDIWGTSDDGLIPTGCSNAKNAGLNAGVVGTDVVGTARPQFTITDIGAYETTLQPISTRVYVKANATGNNDGTSWANAFISLQSVLKTCVQYGVEVWVASGTYKPTTTNNRNINFNVPSGMKLFGGFAGTETSLSQRPSNVIGGGVNATILSGNIGNSNDSSDNTIHLISSYNAAKGSVIDGFTIQDGFETSSINTKAAGLTIAANNGRNELQVSHCIFKNNTGNYTSFNNGDAVVINCEGAAVTKAIIYNNVFTNNRAYWSSGLRIISEGDSSINTISNNIFYQNKNERGGTILTGWNSGFDMDTFSNNTFYGNSTTNGTSIISVDTRIEFFNNIVWNNTGTVLFNSISTLNANYNNIQNNELNGVGIGNINAAPLFINENNPIGADNIWGTADDGLMLQHSSPSVNTGSNSFTSNKDINNTQRPQYSTVDMGAYEVIKDCKPTNAHTKLVNYTYRGDTAVTDAQGWTCYCDSLGVALLSLKLGSTGAVISPNQVQIKVSSIATYSSLQDGGMITNPDGYTILNKRWNINPTTQPSNPVAVRYYFEQIELDSITAALAAMPSPTNLSSPTQLQVYKTSSSSGFTNPHTTSGLLLNNSSTASLSEWQYSLQGTRHVAEFMVNSFSGGGIGFGGGGMPLPLEFMHFDAFAVNSNSSKLVWQVSPDVQNGIYEIRRSTDGKNFISLGNIKHISITNSFQFLDINIPVNTEWALYQIVLKDASGKSISTEIKKVNFSTQTAFNIYPNPANNFIQILSNGENKIEQIKIMNTLGAIFIHQAIETQNPTIDLSKLNAGVYIVQILQNVQWHTHKLIKQ